MENFLKILPVIVVLLVVFLIREGFSIYKYLRYCRLHEAAKTGNIDKVRDLIKEGYHQELDEIVSLLRDGKQLILDLEQKERERTGIPKLKVGFNKVFGYFIEVSKANSDLVPDH